MVDGANSIPRENPGIQDWLAQIGERIPSSLQISDLRDGFGIRGGGLDQSHIELLCEAAAPLPPIVVHRPTMRVVDGLHRVQAARRKGTTTLTAEYFDGTEDEAFALSVFLNVGHGLALTRAERRAALHAILDSHPEWSDRFVGRMVGLSHRTVATARRAAGDASNTSSRIGVDGKVRPIDPAAGRHRAAALLAETPDLTLRELARRAGISASTAKDVRARLHRGLDPVSTPGRPADNLTSSHSDNGLDPDTSTDIAASFGRPDELSGAQPDRLVANTPMAPIPNVLLERLRKDPAVRFNESGRQLVRQLAATHGAFVQVQVSLGAVPAHCSPALAQIARSYAAAWKALAEKVEGRSNGAGLGQQTI